MVDINRLLNGTSSGLIAQKLDELDGNKNGRIEASIWNEFVKDKGGKEVQEFITVGDAMRSICHYAVKNGKADADTLAAGWLQTATEQVAQKKSQSTQNSDPVPAQTPQASESASQPEASAETSVAPTKQEQINADYQSVKVTVPEKTVTAKKPQNKAERDDIILNQKTAKEVADEIRVLSSKTMSKSVLDGYKLHLASIDKDNAAYMLERIPDLVEVIDGVDWFGAGLGKKDVIEHLLKPLVQKAEELGINNIGKMKRANYVAFANYIKLADMEKDIKALAKQIREVEREKLKEYDDQMRAYSANEKEVNTYNNNLPKIQKAFDEATKLLAEVANMDSKPQVEDVKDCSEKLETVNLPDGRHIQIQRDKNSGEIIAIWIGTDTNADDSAVAFDKDIACYSTDKHKSNNGQFEGTIATGYEFEKLKALAKKIFG